MDPRQILKRAMGKSPPRTPGKTMTPPGTPLRKPMATPGTPSKKKFAPFELLKRAVAPTSALAREPAGPSSAEGAITVVADVVPDIVGLGDPAPVPEQAAGGELDSDNADKVSDPIPKLGDVQCDCKECSCCPHCPGGKKDSGNVCTCNVEKKCECCVACKCQNESKDEKGAGSSREEAAASTLIPPKNVEDEAEVVKAN